MFDVIDFTPLKILVRTAPHRAAPHLIRIHILRKNPIHNYVFKYRNKYVSIVYYSIVYSQTMHIPIIPILFFSFSIAFLSDTLFNNNIIQKMYTNSEADMENMIRTGTTPNGKNVKVCNVLSLGIAGTYYPIYMAMLDKYRLPKYDLYAGISIGGSLSGILSYYDYEGDIQGGMNLFRTEIFNTLNQSVCMIYQNPVQMIRSKSLVSSHWMADIHATVMDKIVAHRGESRRNKIDVPSLIGSINRRTGKFEVFDLSDYNDNVETQIRIFMSTIAIGNIYSPVVIFPKKEEVFPKKEEGEYYDSDILDNQPPPHTSSLNHNSKKHINNNPNEEKEGDEYMDGGAQRSFILHEIEEYITCGFYNITIFSPLYLDADDYSFSHSSLHYFINNYLRLQYKYTIFAQTMVSYKWQCPQSKREKGMIHLCFIRGKGAGLARNSPLDFDVKQELYDIGAKYSVCERYRYCN